MLTGRGDCVILYLMFFIHSPFFSPSLTPLPPLCPPSLPLISPSLLSPHRLAKDRLSYNGSTDASRPLSRIANYWESRSVTFPPLPPPPLPSSLPSPPLSPPSPSPPPSSPPSLPLTRRTLSPACRKTPDLMALPARPRNARLKSRHGPQYMLEGQGILQRLFSRHT